MSGLRVILQVRSSSKRLPNKALMKICGYPTFILSAIRRKNRGCDLIVATSEESSDDMVEIESERHGMKIFRGSLENVYARYVSATSDMKDTDVCVRATADNLVPDGSFVEEVSKVFMSSDRSYLSSNEVFGQTLPHGVIVEAFKVGLLRQAGSDNNLTDFEKEHVTPRLREISGFSERSVSVEYPLNLSIDDVASFNRVEKLFSNLKHPESESWEHLVEKARLKA